MWNKLILVVVVLACGGIFALTELMLKPKLGKLQEDGKKTAADLATEQERATKLGRELSTTKEERDKLSSDLSDTKRAEADAKKQADDEGKKAAAAAVAAAAARKETADVKSQSAEYFKMQESGLTPAVIRTIATELPKATNELATIKTEQRVLMVEHQRVAGEFDALRNPNKAVLQPAGLRGKVVTVDPKWDFVVLDIGGNHGVLKNGELTLTRDGRFIARVKAATVDTTYCIANILTGFKATDIREGDQAIAPHDLVQAPKLK